MARREATSVLSVEWAIIDCVDIAGMSRFWCRALNYEVVWTGPYGGHVLAGKDGSHIRLGLMPCPATKSSKNRIHLDLRPGDQEVEVARLEGLGARRVNVGQGNVPWVVMADPEGNEFCVLSAGGNERFG